MSVSPSRPPLTDALRAALAEGLARQCHGKTAVIAADADDWQPIFEDRIRRVQVGSPSDIDAEAGAFRTVILLDPADQNSLENLLPRAWGLVGDGGRLIVVAGNAAAVGDGDGESGFERKALRKTLKLLGKVRLLKDHPFRWLAMNVIKCDEGERELSADKRRRYEVTAGLCRGQVLELGCGRGHLATFAAGRGCEVVGVDQSSSRIADARHRYPDHRFLVGDILEVDLPEASFDTVLLPEVLEHVDEQSGGMMLDRAWRWLAPGGRLVVSVPNEDCIPHPHHIRWFDAASLSQELRNYGKPLIVTNQPYKWLLMFVEKTESPANRSDKS